MTCVTPPARRVLAIVPTAALATLAAACGGGHSRHYWRHALLASALVASATSAPATALARGASTARGAASVSTTDADDLMRAQIPLVHAAEQIKAAAASPSGYTSIVLSVPEHLLTLYWKGAVPAPVTQAIQRLTSDSVHIQVKAARYSNDELDHQVDGLKASRARFAVNGVDLEQLTPHKDGSGIDVGIRLHAGSKSTMARAAADLTRASAIPLQVQHAEPATPSSRLDDLPLHWAGARIIDVSGSWSCTTGFPMQRRSDGRTFITTAAHCAGNNQPANLQWWDWWGPHDIYHRMGEAWYNNFGLDASYIRPPNGWVEGRNYDGGVAPGTEFSKPVHDVGGAWYGSSVCTSGAWTGVHCGITVNRWSNIEINGNWIGTWIGYAPSGQVAQGLGDSGGTVFSLSATPGAITALGSISGGITTPFGCTNNNGESDTCYNDVAFVPEQSILDWLGANILTQ